jgi:Radical SAM proteins, N-terminal
VRWRSLSTENRAYLPAADLAQKLRDTQTALFGVESQKSLAEFDILGFSLSDELGATNILEMLSLAGIPLTWREDWHHRYSSTTTDTNLF